MNLKRLKIFHLVCFAVAITIAITNTADNDDGHRVNAIGWCILAAAAAISYTWITIEENNNKRRDSNV